jgi:transposase-like protein
MSTQAPFPKTLIDAVSYFANEDTANQYAADMRWPEGVACPTCGSKNVGFIAKRRRWYCKDCPKKPQFSVKTGTIMEDSPIPVGKWLVVIWLECNAKNSISSYEVHRSIGVTQKSAWFMLHRVRLAMQNGSLEKMSGTVEADETFIGGKAINMHKKKREQNIKGRGPVGKAVVMGLLERHGGEDEASKVKAFVVADRKRKTLQPVVKDHVEPGSSVYTDSLASYAGLSPEYVHEFIDHAECYVRGAVHTNGMENFWSLLKRCIKGTHVSIDPQHLYRYVDSEAFRFNNRKLNDGERFVLAVHGIIGKRLTYKELIGDNPECPPETIQP